MIRKSMKKPLARLSDDALATVSGATGQSWYFGSPITNVQTNVAGPVVQLAVLNGGAVAQAVGLVQGNFASFG
ncbi:MAG: hypothetical protein ACM3S3_08905 [Candidatus Doudnabacteria bacterium]